MVNNIPKVDLHVHLEGTITPEMVELLAKRNNISVPENLIKVGKFYWEDDGTAAGALTGFLKSYDAATSVMKTAEDYTDITYDYLKRSADENCIYAEKICIRPLKNILADPDLHMLPPAVFHLCLQFEGRVPYKVIRLILECKENIVLGEIKPLCLLVGIGLDAVRKDFREIKKVLPCHCLRAGRLRLYRICKKVYQA